MALWAAEDMEEDIQDVDLSMAIGNYGQGGYNDGACAVRSRVRELTVAPSAHIAAPDRRVDADCDAATHGAASGVLADPGRGEGRELQCASVRGRSPHALQFIVHFHQAVLDNNLAEITVAYESGWNKYTEKFYARSEWPEAEIIAALVNDGAWRDLYVLKRI